MAISNVTVQERLIKNISMAVGSKIWNYNQGTPEAQPAVFKEKVFSGSTPPSPRYPFISVDILQTLTPYQLNQFEGFVDDTFVVQQLRVIQFSVKVHGDGMIDINQIADELRLKLKAQYYIADMNEIGAGYYKVTNAIKTDSRLTDQYMEVSQFNVSYSVTDFTKITPEEGGYAIEQIEIDTVNNKDPEGRAGLYDFPDDPDPLQIETGLIDP